MNADSAVYTTEILGMNLFAYCYNNPTNMIDPNGTCPYDGTAADFHRLEHGQPPRNCTCGKNNNVIATVNPKEPPDHSGYTPPKKGGGKKVKNPNGPGNGWPAKDGGVWMPDQDMHGGEGWTVQYPGGGHKHAYPGGGVRNHFKAEQSTGESVIMIFVGALATVGLVADNFTGIGAADDALIPGSVACFVGGLGGISGKKVCTECGEVRYGY